MFSKGCGNIHSWRNFPIDLSYKCILSLAYNNRTQVSHFPAFIVCKKKVHLLQGLNKNRFPLGVVTGCRHSGIQIRVVSRNPETRSKTEITEEIDLLWKTNLSGMRVDNHVAVRWREKP